MAKLMSSHQQNSNNNQKATMRLSILHPAAFVHQVKPLRKRLVGLDVSLSTVGVATSDVDWITAAPATTLTRNALNDDAIYLKINQYIDSTSAGGVVVGWPLNTRGERDSSCTMVERFVDSLSGRISIPITLWDERGSSTAAKALLMETSVNQRQTKRKPRKYDHLAATYMLQSFLDEFSDVSPSNR